MSDKDDKKNRGLDQYGIVYVSGDIDTAKSETICTKIIEHNLRPLDCVQLILNSPGGSVPDGFAIIDVMEWSRLPVRTTALGMLGSMALLVFMAGAKGHRVLTPRVSILSHRYAWWSFGRHSELIARRKEEDLTHARILEHYRQHTKIKSDEELQRTLLGETDTWLTAEEAVAFGIADAIENRSPAG
jgi:ATP-dependent Clp protease protease subunit